MSIRVLSYLEEGLEETLSSLHIAAFPKGMGWKVKDFVSVMDISFHHILIDGDQNEIKGFILYSMILDEVEILTFCVSPAHQNKGIGNQLMIVFIQQMLQQQVKSIFLEVAENNISALKLYNKHGFCQNGRRLNYYQNKINALLMVKTF